MCVPLLSTAQKLRLQEWLNVTGELFADIYQPRSGGGGTGCFVRTVEQLEEPTTKLSWPKRLHRFPKESGFTLFCGIIITLTTATGADRVTHTRKCRRYSEWWREGEQALAELLLTKIVIGFTAPPDEAMSLDFERRGDHYAAVGQ